MNKSLTHRGFTHIEFYDRYYAKCSLQKSSLACEDAIWLGVDDAEPKIMASKANVLDVDTNETCGWVKYPLPEEVLLTTRMHLTRGQVAKLLLILQNFVDTGEL